MMVRSERPASVHGGRDANPVGRGSASAGVRSLDMLRIAFYVTLLLAMLTCVTLLFYSWNNYLVPGGSRAVFGYDPYRFFFYAKELAGKGISLNDLRAITLNYNGIVLYYGIIFAAFGVLSWVPPLINLGALGLVIYRLIKNVQDGLPSARMVACIPLILLYPDVLWFGTMTGKELPSIILIVIVASAGLRHSKGMMGVRGFVTAAVGLLLLVGVRPSLVFIPIATFLLYVAWSPRRSAAPSVVYLLLAVGALFAAPHINEFLGSQRFDAVSLFTDSVNRYEAIERQGMLHFGSDSFSRVLYSKEPWVIVLTLPLKIVWYLTAPLQSPNFSWAGLAAGKWADVQNFCTSVSALINIALLPYVLHTLLGLRSPEQYPAWRESATFFAVLFGVSLATVVLSGLEFHVRFRSLFIVPYIVLAVLSFGFRSPLLDKLRWGSYLGLGGAFALYAAVKL